MLNPYLFIAIVGFCIIGVGMFGYLKDTQLKVTTTVVIHDTRVRDGETGRLLYVGDMSENIFKNWKIIRRKSEDGNSEKNLTNNID